MGAFLCQIPVFTAKANVSALGSFGAFGMNELIFVGRPERLGIGASSNIGNSLLARCIELLVRTARKRYQYTEASLLIGMARGVVQRGGEHLDQHTGRRAKCLDLCGVQEWLAVGIVLDFPLVSKQQDEIIRAKVEFARAVILQAVELRVAAAHAPKLKRQPAEANQSKLLRGIHVLQCRHAWLVCRAHGLRQGNVFAHGGNQRLGQLSWHIAEHPTESFELLVIN